MAKEDIEYIERTDIKKASIEYVIELCAMEISKLNAVHSKI